MADDAVIVDHLRKQFTRRRSRGERHADHLLAVDDVSFAVPGGGSLAIVGESGSGKTTTARMIVGLEEPTSGSIIVAGRPRLAGRQSRRERERRGREVQIVFQDPYLSLDPRQTVAACLDEVLRFHFRSDRATRRRGIEELLAQVGLDSRLGDRLPKALSGGQRQRVAIARALGARPHLLVLDEAVSALDVSMQAQILNLLADLRSETDVSYIFITHNLGIVQHVCDEIAVMRAGKIVEYGPCEAVLNDPQAPYTMELLASIPRPGWHPGKTATLLEFGAGNM